jgi:hypothetical protein
MLHNSTLPANLMNLKVAVVAVSLLPTAASAWPWGPKSFEECMSAEMKNRPPSQTALVTDSCRKQFPALPSYRSARHTGTLYCFSTAIPTDFLVQIDSATIQVAKCSYAISFRDSQLVKANAKEICLVQAWTAGTNFVVNFDHGFGTFSDSRDYRNQISFECREAR